MMVSDFMQRNKAILSILILAIAIGLFIKYKLMPTDTQKLNAFHQQLVMVNAPLESNVIEFSYTYNIAMHTNNLYTLYMTAMNLNVAAKEAIMQANTSFQVPSFKNKKVQAYVQYSHDLFRVYAISLERLSQKTIDLAQKSGYIAKLPPLTVPTTTQISDSLGGAYQALKTK